MDGVIAFLKQPCELCSQSIIHVAALWKEGGDGAVSGMRWSAVGEVTLQLIGSSSAAWGWTRAQAKETGINTISGDPIVQQSCRVWEAD